MMLHRSLRKALENAVMAFYIRSPLVPSQRKYGQPEDEVIVIARLTPPFYLFTLNRWLSETRVYI